MIDHNPSSGLSDLHRYLIASPTQRHIVWLGEGVPYVPDTLPDSALIISTESAESTGLGQSSATHAQSPESFVIDPACVRSEDQAGEPWPVYELADDLVEQALGVS